MHAQALAIADDDLATMPPSLQVQHGGSALFQERCRLQLTIFHQLHHHQAAVSCLLYYSCSLVNDLGAGVPSRALPCVVLCLAPSGSRREVARCC